MFAKQKSSVFLASILLAVTGSLLTPSAASASVTYVEGTDQAAAMYNPMQVNKFSMQMSDEDYESLRAPNVGWDYEGDWRKTRMSFNMGGKNYGPYVVGVHLKGAWGSWRDISGKAAFKIKMDAFVEGQTLFGVSRITLNNMVQDRSYLREVISYRLYRNLGIPAPRTGYADVSLNGVNYGLHLNIETLNKQMLKRWGISSSHLYKGAVPYFPDLYRGSEWMFAVESGSETDTSDLSEFMALNELDGQEWFEAISSRMDIELLTRSWASELYSGHWDGYVRNLNNYFVNFDDEGKVHLLPWGVDQTWGGALGYTESRAVMPNKCWSYDPCLDIYRQSLAKVARVAKGLELENMVKVVGTAIKTSVVTDPFGNGLSVATSYQDNLIWRIRDQQTVLSSIVRPFDTTLASIRVDGRFYKPDENIYLAPGTKTANLTVTTSQASASSVIQPIGTLRTGWNSASVVVTSSDQQHVNTNLIKFYVYQQFTKKSVPAFHNNSSVPTFAGLTSIGLLGTELKGGLKMTLEISMAKSKATSTTKAKALMASRVKYLLKSLEAKGVKPSTVTQKIVSSGSVNALQVSAKYQK
jgi:hypothetical protein